jgi:DNA mismatch repair protein MutS2
MELPFNYMQYDGFWVGLVPSISISWYTVQGMDEKTLNTLEFPKVRERLAGYAAFSASASLIRALRPTPHLEDAQDRLARTSEARRLLSVNGDVSVGGTSDIRPLAERARRSGVLEAGELLEIKTTLIVARDLARTLERSESSYPRLVQIGQRMPPPPGVIEAISRCISERGEVLDSASEKLAALRRQVRVAHERLMAKLEKLVTDSKVAPMLQEAIITQRSGRYVVPLRADFKGRLKAIVHDQSSSGATLFVEPLAVVDLNNEWQTCQLAEKEEERRILAELSAQVGEGADAIRAALDALAEFDFVLACAKFAEDLHASEPVLMPFRKPGPGHHPGSVIHLMKARHPLLDQSQVVPIDVVLDEATYALVITGPNTGGKTVTLKTVGLLAAMAQCGLHIPVQSGSELSIFKQIYADVGDEQSIEQSLSTFSGHITNIVRILNRADHNSLVLLDELGAGTDPQEGSALARAILANLVERGITCLVATHYPELKAFAHTTAGAINASMEFDLNSLRPTYHLNIGLPGRSNALAIAERLGLSKEIVGGARTLLDPTDLHADDLLDEIHRQRDLAEKSHHSAEQTRQEAESLRRELNERLEKIEDERRTVLEEAQLQAEKETHEVRQELDDVRKALAHARQPLEALKPLQQQVETLQEVTQAPVVRKATPSTSKPGGFRLGGRVHLRSVHLDGVITGISEDEVEVQVGNLRLRARRSDVSLSDEPEVEVPPEKPAEKSRKGQTVVSAPLHASPGMELDIRGQRADDALEALDHYIEDAYLAGMPFVRIIHGKGTGRLRQLIREALKQSLHVTSYESGLEGEGGDGVTVAHLD